MERTAPWDFLHVSSALPSFPFNTISLRWIKFPRLLTYEPLDLFFYTDLNLMSLISNMQTFPELLKKTFLSASLLNSLQEFLGWQAKLPSATWRPGAASLQGEISSTLANRSKRDAAERSGHFPGSWAKQAKSQCMLSSALEQDPWNLLFTCFPWVHRLISPILNSLLFLLYQLDHSKPLLWLRWLLVASISHPPPTGVLVLSLEFRPQTPNNWWTIFTWVSRKQLHMETSQTKLTLSFHSSHLPALPSWFWHLYPSLLSGHPAPPLITLS